MDNEHERRRVAALARRAPDLQYRTLPAAACKIIEAVRAAERFDDDVLGAILRQYPRDGKAVFAKEHLVRAYRALCASGALPYEREVYRRLQMKPMRTRSGVAPVAVMTKPWPCPGRCLFCPSEPSMPKSYLCGRAGGDARHPERL